MSHRMHRTGRAASIAAGLATVCLAGTASAVDLSVKADATDALIVGDAPTTVTVTVTADAAADAGDYVLQQQFVDRYGQVTEGPAVEFALTDRWQQQVDVPVEHYGPTTYKASLLKAGEAKPTAEAEQMLIRPVPLPRLSRAERAASPMGINVHLGAHWESLAAMGVHWARDYSWGWLGDAARWPLAQNGTDFTDTEPRADRAGITILPIMQQAFRTPDKSFFISDGDRIAAAYERLSDALPQLAHWELDNEADLVHRDRTSEDFRRWFESYVDYIRHADRGLKAAGHDAQVVLNGEAGIHLEQVRELIDRVGDHFAVVNYHFYTGTVAPELARQDINTGAEDRPRTTSFLDQMRQINRLAHEAGKEAWLTEIAWSARSGPAVGDRLQSAYLARLYLLAEWAGTDKTFWFWDRDLPPGGRFSSTEFIQFTHGDEGARPVGAAMAAVARFIAQARYVGSVDVGEDRWCLLFRTPDDDGWLAAAWAVHGEHGLPSTLADADEAFGMYANPLRDPQLTAEPAYFHLRELPADWEAQLQVEWLSPRIINVYQSSTADLELQAPTDARLVLENLPAGATVTMTPPQDEGPTRGTLLAAPELAAATYEITQRVTGEGWEKQFPLTLVVRPAIELDAVPFTPGQTGEVHLSNLLPRAVDVTLRPEAGSVEPSTISVGEDGSAVARFTAPQSGEAPIAVEATLSDGATQRYWIRPRQLTVPRADSITIDGDLRDWPEGGEIVSRATKLVGPESDFDPRMRLAWSPDGLYVAAVIPVGEDFRSPPKPDAFWEWTSVELFLSAADLATEPGVNRRHQLWFVPVKDADDDAWRVYAGEWAKPMPDGEAVTLKDDDRNQTAMRYDGQNVTIEVLIPPDVLEAAPQAGMRWPLTINARVAEALSPRTLVTWPAGRGAGAEAWGEVIFGE